MSLAADAAAIFEQIATASAYPWDDAEVVACGLTPELVATLLPLAKCFAERTEELEQKLEAERRAGAGSDSGFLRFSLLTARVCGVD